MSRIYTVRQAAAIFRRSREIFYLWHNESGFPLTNIRRQSIGTYQRPDGTICQRPSARVFTKVDIAKIRQWAVHTGKIPSETDRRIIAKLGKVYTHTEVGAILNVGANAIKYWHKLGAPRPSLRKSKTAELMFITDRRLQSGEHPRYSQKDVEVLRQWAEANGKYFPVCIHCGTAMVHERKERTIQRTHPECREWFLKDQYNASREARYAKGTFPTLTPEQAQRKRDYGRVKSLRIRMLAKIGERYLEDAGVTLEQYMEKWNAASSLQRESDRTTEDVEIIKLGRWN